MQYLVTGGAGFIGSNTVDELVRRGHGVTVLDDLSAAKEANLEKVRPQITFIRGSITDREAVEKACRGADYVLHLAARTSVPRSVKQPLETNQINVDGTLNVLVAARDAGVRRVVFASSSSIYGDTPTLPKHEGMPPAPISPYGVTKLVGEAVRPRFSPHLWPRFRGAALFQRLWPAAGSRLALLGSAFAIHRRDAQWRRAECVRRRRAVARFHLCAERGGGESASPRDSGHWRPGVQSRDRGALHAELHIASAGGVCGEAGESEAWSAAGRRYPRFAGGHFAGGPELRI